MGFSVSGATAVILIGLFVAFAIAYPAMIGSIERISDAQDSQSERLMERQNTAVELEHAAYAHEGGWGTLDIVVSNTGTVPLSVSGTDVLVDGSYIDDPTMTVENDSSTDLWLPGERLEIEVMLEQGQPNPPDRVQIVTHNGIATAGNVTEEDDDG